MSGAKALAGGFSLFCQSCISASTSRGLTCFRKICWDAFRTVRVSPDDSEVLVFQFEGDAISIIADDPPGLVASVVAWPKLMGLIIPHCSFSP
jgi:hypothetical protein